MTTWAVTSMQAKKQEAGYTDVVFLVEWLASDTDGVNEARSGGKTTVPISEGNFTPYDQLTEAQVLGWVWNVMGPDAKAALEANLAEQIAYMQDPPVVSPPLPWG